MLPKNRWEVSMAFVFVFRDLLVSQKLEKMPQLFQQARASGVQT